MTSKTPTEEDFARLQAERDRAVEIIDWAREELHQRRVADWFPEGAHNAAEQMSEDMRLIGNRLADLDFSTLPPPVKEAEPPAPSRVVTAESYLAAIAGRPDDLDVLGALPDIIAHWVANNLGVALTLTEARQAARAALTTPPALQARVEALEKVKDRAENLVIAHGMGWDIDGCLDELRAAITGGRDDG